MKIDHFALYVRDLESAKDFFVRYFNAVHGEMYYNPATVFRSYFLRFPDGDARLELMNRPELHEDSAGIFRCGYVHLAFSVGSKEQVDRLTARLQADGYAVLSGPRMTGDGCYESCIAGPEGNLVEITE